MQNYYLLGMDAWYTGSKMPENITVDQQRDWKRGWRTIDNREINRNYQIFEDYDVFSD